MGTPIGSRVETRIELEMGKKRLRKNIKCNQKEFRRRRRSLLCLLCGVEVEEVEEYCYHYHQYDQ